MVLPFALLCLETRIANEGCKNKELKGYLFTDREIAHT